ncbi:MAG: GDYXXLXY domain-containing protein [Polyangiales bacterium]
MNERTNAASIPGQGWLAFALVLPLAVIGISVFQYERMLQDGTVWEFAIDGYDPRDLLRGHYLEFRIATNHLDDNDELRSKMDSGSGVSNNCFCLRRSDDKTIATDMGCSSAKQECDAFVKRDLLDEINRYYIAEARVDEFEKLLQDAARENRATIAVRIDNEGTPTIESLLIDGTPIESLRSSAPPTP